MTAPDLGVLIVGAGPTGLLLANELVRHGVTPRIIDRAPQAATTSRALVVQPRTLEILDDLGVAEQAFAAGTAASELTITFADKTVDVDFAGQLTGPQNLTAYPEPRTLSQHDTERILTDLLSRHGVEIERGVALTDFTQDGDAVTASLRHGDGATESVRCQWLAGCDGAHSAVRKASGIPFSGDTYRDEFIMADAELDWKLPHGGLYGFPSPAGIFAAFSMPGTNRYRIFGNFPPGPDGPSAEYSEPTHDEFQAMVDERVPFPATVVKEFWVTRYRVHSRTVPRYRDGRIFLVGDAAHVHSPAGAQGMNTGIQDAYNLGWKLAFVVRGLADESLVDSYNAERHPIGVQLLKTTDRMFSVFGGQNPLARLARGRVAPVLASHVLSRGWVRRRFIGLLAQLRLHYPDSPLNAQDGSDWHDAPAPGDRAREADVLIDGNRGRLYDVFRGTHHTVLLFTGLDDEARPAIELCRIAEQLEQENPGLVKARVVTAERFADHPAALGDPTRSAHRQYGMTTPGAFVIRPDKYISYRGRPVELVAQHLRYQERQLQ
ncbi:2-polyprenyl-6-methoxyphenol hydroxylase-like FAD-dependent oxidoreductase [Mycolicibacterium sp. BK556]|uniref:FAD-dependent monooxygenase n=1 Tax=unclassified Mycolicibacterium TaxID=2636767 RepID=UPI00161A38C9|nr:MULTISPECIES: FAD-dependent monooxygenase [unclassified Mycolicibacterium]MBB3603492.1 2-polyprenyl-6-methoxyphenol hydroxylase-like FAD-dependent oxidoreductase [Mycolicibacterium sp. BK556]MBB3633687.1 2-polyprenyl-6-methoxyphenol hydroxylase-like FAD-dependent oxidoreductase [Mycolicibacterium sp. BK607]MBB3751269.1 2-polyprenyl-6-methoxyphenol hydroxylase-like FAD-dependent oxidoreductase [Mycolicibacterium sp. BK634]